MKGEYEPVLANSRSYYENINTQDQEEIGRIKANADLIEKVKGESIKDAYYENYAIEKETFSYIQPNAEQYSDIVNKVYQYIDNRKQIEVMVQYPVLYETISGLSEKETETINHLLKKKFIEKSKIDVDTDMYTREFISYKITMFEPSYLSLIVYGTVYTRGDNHPADWSEGITINLKKGTVVSLTDIFSNTQKIAVLVKEGNYDVYSLHDLDKCNPDSEAEKERLKRKFYEDFKESFDLLKDFYLEKDKIGIILPTQRYYYSIKIDKRKVS